MSGYPAATELSLHGIRRYSSEPKCNTSNDISIYNYIFLHFMYCRRWWGKVGWFSALKFWKCLCFKMRYTWKALKMCSLLLLRYYNISPGELLLSIHAHQASEDHSAIQNVNMSNVNGSGILSMNVFHSFFDAGLIYDVESECSDHESTADYVMWGVFWCFWYPWPNFTLGILFWLH